VTPGPLPRLAMLALVAAAGGPDGIAPPPPPAVLVIDGNTLEIDGRRMLLWGINAPNPATAVGWQAKLLLSMVASEGPPSCTVKRLDPALWQCRSARGSDIGSLMVQTGLAYAAGPYYQHEQDLARLAGYGLWRPNDGRDR